MKEIILVKGARVGENYSYEEQEYMNANNVQIFNSFLKPRKNNTYDLVIMIED